MDALTSASGSSVSSSAPPEAVGTRCPLLLGHLETRNPQRRIVVADTARASPRSLAAYAHLRGRFAFLGIPDELTAQGEDVVDALAAGLARYGARVQDLMLLWDLPNYLDADGLARMAVALRRGLRTGGRLHMLVASSQRWVSDRPGHYEILPGWAGVVVEQGEPVRQAPRYTPWQVEQAFQGFETERSVLLRSGMQEYLLRLKMSASTPDEAG
ncbi:hypothetical protein H0Z60_11245 [Ectothiorhodospiraceae bacterium WFHF3C12]|nr:hypothetical protein [Ectothiorhodospiraceae bacterium WFHF3C12]